MISSKISLSTDRVRLNFSKAADHYDILTRLQRNIADELLQKIEGLQPKQILDIGCGTGYLTGKIKDCFIQEDVWGVDFSEGMIAKAEQKFPGIHWALEDAQGLSFRNEQFDLVVSNLAYQWVDDMPKALSEACRVLSREGVFTASLFGFNTCKELFISLKETGASKEDLKRLPTAEIIAHSLEHAGFQTADVECQRGSIGFKNLSELLEWIKAIGANGFSKGQFLGPKALEKANQYALKNYPHPEGVAITFEVIFIYGKKK